MPVELSIPFGNSELARESFRAPITFGSNVEIAPPQPMALEVAVTSRVETTVVSGGT